MRTSRRRLPALVAIATAAVALCLPTALPAVAASGGVRLYSTDVPPYTPFLVFAEEVPGGDVPGTLLLCTVGAWAQPADVVADPDIPVTVSAGTWTARPASGPRTTTFGRAGDQPLCLDADGDGQDELAVRRGNQYFVAGSYAPGGRPVTSFRFGRSTDVPLTGDWDGDGDDEIALKRGNVYFFASANVDGGGRVRTSAYGRATDVAVAGRFTDGKVTGQAWDSLALRRGNRFFVTGDRPGGRLRTDASFAFGRSTDVPLAGARHHAPTEALFLARVRP